MLQIKYTSINNNDDDQEAVWRQNKWHQQTRPSPLKGLWVNSLLTPLFPGGRGEVSFQLKNLQHSLAQVGSWQQLFAFLVLGRYKCDALNC